MPVPSLTLLASLHPVPISLVLDWWVHEWQCEILDCKVVIIDSCTSWIPKVPSSLYVQVYLTTGLKTKTDCYHREMTCMMPLISSMYACPWVHSCMPNTAELSPSRARCTPAQGVQWSYTCVLAFHPDPGPDFTHPQGPAQQPHLQPTLSWRH